MEKYKCNEGYLYNDSFSEKEFINAVLKYIKDDNLSPSYIFDEMELSNVSRINVPIILSSGKANIEYKRKIGYDRIVTTTKYKTTTYGNGFQNRTQSSSSKTVTDWKNDNGTITGDATSGIYADKYKIYDEYITNHKMDRNNVSILKDDVLEKYTLSEDDIEYLKNDILNKVFENNITYPGNHVKDQEYYGDVELYNSSCTIVSLYSVIITIRDTNLQFIAASNGDIEIKLFGEYPFDNYDELLKYNREVTKERLAATKSPRKNAKIISLFSVLLFILLLILGISLSILALTIISIVLLILGLILTIKYLIDIKNISKPYYQKIAERNKKDYQEKERIKEEGFQSYLNKMNK